MMQQRADKCRRELYNVAGQFSQAQREIYEAVLEVQQACIQLVYPGGLTLNDIYNEMLTLLGRQLQRLGLVHKELSSAQLLQVCTR